jgi:hypothetical protein
VSQQVPAFTDFVGFLEEPVHGSDRAEVNPLIEKGHLSACIFASSPVITHGKFKHRRSVQAENIETGRAKLF